MRRFGSRVVPEDVDRYLGVDQRRFVGSTSEARRRRRRTREFLINARVGGERCRCDGRSTPRDSRGDRRNRGRLRDIHPRREQDTGRRIERIDHRVDSTSRQARRRESRPGRALAGGEVRGIVPVGAGEPAPRGRRRVRILRGVIVARQPWVYQPWVYQPWVVRLHRRSLFDEAA